MTSLAIVFFLIMISNQSTSTDNPQLYIDTVDKVSSGGSFTVSVYTYPPPQNMTPYVVDVLIIFNGKEYVIGGEDEDGEITIVAPHVVENTTLQIVAYKEGYNPGFKNITITPSPYNSSNKLVVTPNVFILKAHQKFTVTITDENGKPVEGVTVGIRNYTGEGSIDKTDANGYANLIAPNTPEITIIAEKEGYIDGVENIPVIIATEDQPFYDTQFLYLIVAALILLASIIYVTIKDKLNIGLKKDTISIDGDSSKLSKESVEVSEKEDIDIVVERKKDDKIEEIYIRRPSNKIAESNQLSSEEDFQWFTEDKIQQRIDELTKNVEGEEEWFKGVEEIRIKIDKKLKERSTSKG